MPRLSDPTHRWRQWLAHEREAWLDAVSLDPLLPHRLLPATYLGREAHRVRRKALRAFASHFFGTPA
jgi:DNA-binding transcriptional regulator PaaX